MEESEEDLERRAILFSLEEIHHRVVVMLASVRRTNDRPPDYIMRLIQMDRDSTRLIELEKEHHDRI